MIEDNRIETSFHLFIRRRVHESRKRRQNEEKPDPFGTWQFRFHLQRRLLRIILHLLRQTQSEIIINLRPTNEVLLDYFEMDGSDGNGNGIAFPLFPPLYIYPSSLLRDRFNAQTRRFRFVLHVT